MGTTSRKPRFARGRWATYRAAGAIGVAQTTKLHASESPLPVPPNTAPQPQTSPASSLHSLTAFGRSVRPSHAHAATGAAWRAPTTVVEQYLSIRTKFFERHVSTEHLEVDLVTSDASEILTQFLQFVVVPLFEILPA